MLGKNLSNHKAGKKVADQHISVQTAGFHKLLGTESLGRTIIEDFVTRPVVPRASRSAEKRCVKLKGSRYLRACLRAGASQ